MTNYTIVVAKNEIAIMPTIMGRYGTHVIGIRHIIASL